MRKSYIFGLTAVLFWSTIATAFKIALAEVGVFHLMVGASLVTIICLGIILIYNGKLHFYKKLSLRHVAKSALLGFLNPLLYYAILLKAYQILPAQEALVLNYFWPITLVLLSIPLLKQKIGWTSIVSILISFAGVIVIATKGTIGALTLSNWFGDLLAIGSSLVWSLYWIYNMKDEREETEKLFLNFLFGFFYAIIGLLIFEKPTLPTLKGVLAISYIGIFELGLTFVLWLKALKLAERTDSISQLVYISPFVSLLFINWILKEAILRSTIYGLILIIAGILLQQHFARIRRKKIPVS